MRLTSALSLLPISLGTFASPLIGRSGRVGTLPPAQINLVNLPEPPGCSPQKAAVITHAWSIAREMVTVASQTSQSDTEIWRSSNVQRLFGPLAFSSQADFRISADKFVGELTKSFANNLRNRDAINRNADRVNIICPNPDQPVTIGGSSVRMCSPTNLFAVSAAIEHGWSFNSIQICEPTFAALGTDVSPSGVDRQVADEVQRYIRSPNYQPRNAAVTLIHECTHQPRLLGNYVTQVATDTSDLTPARRRVDAETWARFIWSTWLMRTNPEASTRLQGPGGSGSGTRQDPLHQSQPQLQPQLTQPQLQPQPQLTNPQLQPQLQLTQPQPQPQPQPQLEGYPPPQPANAPATEDDEDRCCNVLNCVCRK